MYVGRFAPSPTGPLHFGSMVAALASWLDARAVRGRWLLRIEDLDAPRQQPGAADQILRALERMGLIWDGPVAYQSPRSTLYDSAAHELQRQTYGAACTRREIADSSLGSRRRRADLPGTCRAVCGRQAPRAHCGCVHWGASGSTIVCGAASCNRSSVKGGFRPLSRDGQFAYQLAVVVGDAAQGAPPRVRGADLLGLHGEQIYLQRLLGYPTPRYLHVPVAVNAAGAKLSKHTGAQPIDPARPDRAIRDALVFLGQSPTADLGEAIATWDPSRIPRLRYRA